MGGGGGGSGPTKQQVQLETQQAVTTANLNLEENSQRKAILSAANGMRAFRGSALSRAVAGNRAGINEQPTGPASQAQTLGAITPNGTSLLDLAPGSGATPAGGAGTSGSAGGGGGGRIGGGARQGGAGQR